jgi:hypothetical protein
MPGMQNVIGSHNNNIFRRLALQDCSKMNTIGDWHLVQGPDADLSFLSPATVLSLPRFGPRLVLG